MNWINGSIIVGNPTTPCTGMGCCELTPGMNTDLTIPVVAISSGEDDFGILITTPTMNYLAQLHPNMARAITDGSFRFDGTALPFFLDPALASPLWPGDQPVNMIGDTNTQITAMRQGAGQGLPEGYLLKFSSIAKHHDPHITGGPGVIQTGGIDIGRWRTGVDAWGNLIFTNGRNLVAFGKNGNVSLNRRSIITGNGSMYTVGGTKQTGFSIGNWNLDTVYLSGGEALETATCFSNSTNVIAFPQNSTGMLIKNKDAVTGSVSFPVSGASNGSDQTIGNLYFFENVNGDLIMRTISGGNEVVFGAVSGLYIGGFQVMAAGTGTEG